MLSESSYYEVALAPAEAISIAAAGWTVQCTAGRLWITEEGGGDVWLMAGESMRLTRRGRTVIESSGAAGFRMSPPHAAWRRRFGHAVVLVGRMVRALPRPATPQRLDAGWSH